MLHLWEFTFQKFTIQKSVRVEGINAQVLALMQQRLIRVLVLFWMLIKQSIRTKLRKLHKVLPCKLILEIFKQIYVLLEYLC